MLESVANVSEGRDTVVIAALADAAGPCLLDVHADAAHHRSVFTMAHRDAAALEEGVRALAAEAVSRIDLRRHQGAHPRLGAIDVVPFVPLGGSTIDDAVAARDRFGAWAAETLRVPSFRYGPERSLPDVRRDAFITLEPDFGEPAPHPSAGAICIGARPVLVAYNLWLAEGSALDAARRIAARLRRPAVRALGLAVGDRVQVSCNLIDPAAFGPADAFDAVTAAAAVERAELVGLLPSAVLAAIPATRWSQLDVGPDRTIEDRLGTR